MATRSKTKQGIQRLKLEGEMTIYNAAEMKASLTDTLAYGLYKNKSLLERG